MIDLFVLGCSSLHVDIQYFCYILATRQDATHGYQAKNYRDLYQESHR